MLYRLCPPGQGKSYFLPVFAPSRIIWRSDGGCGCKLWAATRFVFWRKATAGKFTLRCVRNFKADSLFPGQSNLVFHPNSGHPNRPVFVVFVTTFPYRGI